MPALVLFGRRWAVGTDDFVFLAVIDLLIKGICFTLTGLSFIKNGHILNHFGSMSIFVGVLVIFQVTIILDAFLCYLSSQGGVMETEKRRHVPICLYFRICTEVLFILWNVLTISLWANQIELIPDNEEIRYFILGLIIVNSIIFGLQLLFSLYLYDPLGASKRATIPLEEDSVRLCRKGLTPAHFYFSRTKYSEFWRRRLRILCCRYCSSSDPQDEREVMNEVACLLGRGFGGRDIVHSDAVAGLILLGMKQRAAQKLKRASEKEWLQWNHGSQLRILSQPKLTDDSKLLNWTSFEQLSQIFKFAMASFGWPGFPLMPDVECGRACVHHLVSTKCIPCVKYPVDVVGDNCCYLDACGVKAISEAEFHDIIHVSFENDLFEIPFVIIVDHVTQSVILSCRSTMSTNDWAVNLVAWPTHVEGYPPDFKCHRGYVVTCTRLLKKLDQLGTIEKLFRQYPHYNLVLTGYSLGGACAAVLSLLLLPRYPKLKCYAFSPPGVTMSKAAADFCNDFVLSTTYGDDFVISTGTLQIERLIFSVVQILKEASIPKYRLLLRSLWCFQFRDDLSWITTSSDIKESTTFSDVTSTSDTLHSPQAPLGSKFAPIEGMYPPGKILQIRKESRSRYKEDSNLQPESKWMWKWANRTDFDDARVSKTMFTDHFPYKTQRAFKYFETSSN